MPSLSWSRSQQGDVLWTADRKNPIVFSMAVDRVSEKRNFEAAVSDTTSFRSRLLQYFQKQCVCSNI